MRGRSGWSSLWQRQPNLALLDLDLPDVAGEDVLQRLRTGEGTAHAPIVVLSADARLGQIRAAAGSGSKGVPDEASGYHPAAERGRRVALNPSPALSTLLPRLGGLFQDQ